MPASSSIRAGAAFVEIFADNSSLVKGLAAAENSVKSFGNRVSSIGKSLMFAGGAMAAPLIASAKIFGEMGKNLDELAMRTGIAVQVLSELKYAAQQSGVDVDELALAISRMQKFLVTGTEGGKKAAEALKELGLSAATLRNMSPDQQFKALADKLAAIPDPAMRASKAIEIFGRAGAKMLPMLMQGSSGIDALQRKAREMGISMTAEDVAASKAWQISLINLGDVIKMLGFRVGGALAGALQDHVRKLASVVGNVAGWVKANSGVVVSIAKLTAGVIAAGAGLYVLGNALKLLAPVISVARLAVGVFHLALSGIFTIIGALGPLMMALLTPLGAISAAIIGVGAVVAWQGNYIGQTTHWIGERFRDIVSDVTDARDGIVAAFMSGNIGAAVKVAVSLINLEWTRGCDAIKEVWENTLDGMTTYWNTVITGMKLCWNDFKAFMNDNFVKPSMEAQSGWNYENGGWVHEPSHDESQKEILKGFEENRRLNKIAHDEKMKQLQDELDAAKKGFDAAVKAAKESKPAPGVPAPPAGPHGPMDEALRQTGVVGTFNARSLLSLQGNSSTVMEIARNTRATTEAIKTIDNFLRNGFPGLVYSNV
jgi:hypothetical protein